MNSKILATVLVAAAPLGAALAEDYGPYADRAYQIESSVSREQVAAQAAGARNVQVGEDSGSAAIAASFQGRNTRAQVRAEYLASREEARAMVGEDSGAQFFAQQHRVGAPVYARRSER